MEFGGDMIDAVEHEAVAPTKQFIGVISTEKILYRFDLDIRIDRSTTLRHHLHFRPADSLVKGVDLSIDIGQADVIEINQCQAADTGSGQSLSGIAADSTDTEYGNRSLFETFQAVLSGQQFHPAKAM
jgi:hypothetical protein